MHWINISYFDFDSIVFFVARLVNICQVIFNIVSTVFRDALMHELGESILPLTTLGGSINIIFSWGHAPDPRVHKALPQLGDLLGNGLEISTDVWIILTVIPYSPIIFPML